MFRKVINYLEGSKENKKHAKRKATVIDLLSSSSSSSDDDVMIINEKQNKRNNAKKMFDNSELVIVSSESELSDDNDSNDDINLNIRSWESDGDVSDVNTEVVVKWRKVESPKIWTAKMKKYYNKPCIRQKHFDWKKILQEIRQGPSIQWYISHRDMYPVPTKSKRCLICRQTDHLAFKCPRKNGICTMCGVAGHLYLNCPQSMCLNCGVSKCDYVDYCSNCNFWRNVQCTICKKLGHETNNCTDLWRRFHSTVQYKEIKSSPSTLNKNIQCCNCAKPGHLYEDCPERYFSNYLPPNSLVTNYSDLSEFDINHINNKPQTSNHNNRRHREMRPYAGVSKDEGEVYGKRFKRNQSNHSPKHNRNSTSKQQANFLNFLCLSLPKKLNKKKKKKKKKHSAEVEQLL